MKSFTIYQEYYDLMTLLPKKDRAELALAIIEYMFDDLEPNLNKDQFKVFNNLKRPLDKSKNKSNNNSKQNQKEIKKKSKQSQNEIKNNSTQHTHQDVNVNVSNYDNNYVVNVDVNNNLFTFIEENFGRTLNSIEYEEINTWEDNELTRFAIKKAVLNGVYNIKYISTTLFNWKKKNITNVQQAQKDEEDYKNRNRKSISEWNAIHETPEWLEKEQNETPPSEEDRKELENLLKDFK